MEQVTLANGLEVYLLPNANTGLATIAITARNGSFAQEPEYSGLAHFYEHMFFKANKEIPSQERFLERLRELGVDLGPSANAFTGQEMVVYHMTLQGQLISEGLTFMRNAIVNPLFDQQELERERGVILSELENAFASPHFSFFHYLQRSLFEPVFSRKNVIGDREVIATTTQEKMRFIRDTFYIPNNCALIVAGNFDRDSVRAQIVREFQEWKRGEDPFIKHPVPEIPPLARDRAFIVDRPVKLVRMTIAVQGPSFRTDPKGTYAATLLQKLVSADYSRFKKRFIDSNLAVNAEFYSMTSYYVSTDGFVLEVPVDRVKRARRELIKEIEAIVNDPAYFSNEDIAIARDGLEVERMFSLETSKDQALRLGAVWPLLGVRHFTDYVSELREIGDADIRRYWSTYWKEKPRSIGVVISAEDQRKLGLDETALLKGL